MRLDSLEHVLHVLGVDEGVVDGHHVHHGVLERGAEHQAPDAAEAVDAHRQGAHRLITPPKRVVLRRSTYVARVSRATAERQKHRQIATAHDMEEETKQDEHRGSTSGLFFVYLSQPKQRWGFAG